MITVVLVNKSGSTSKTTGNPYVNMLLQEGVVMLPMYTNFTAVCNLLKSFTKNNTLEVKLQCFTSDDEPLKGRIPKDFIYIKNDDVGVYSK